MFTAFIAALLVASLSLVGAFVFRQSHHITGTHRFIIPVALGMFLGIVFFELIPETIEASHDSGPLVIVIGFLSFYLLSHLLRTYHHHHHEECHDCAPKNSASLLLVGDSIHNIADGVVIASAFAIDPTLGWVTTAGIALHEVPQEIAEFGVLVHSGYSRLKAALLNLLSASSIILGVLLSLAVLQVGDYLWVLTGLAAGNLLYLAASDMIPELNDQGHHGHFAATFISTIVGLAIIITLLQLSHEAAPHDGLEDHPDIKEMAAH